MPNKTKQDKIEEMVEILNKEVSRLNLNIGITRGHAMIALKLVDKAYSSGVEEGRREEEKRWLNQSTNEHDNYIRDEVRYALINVLSDKTTPDLIQAIVEDLDELLTQNQMR